MVEGAIRAAMRGMWTDICTVYEYHAVLKDNKTTVHEEVPIITNEPCRLSFTKLLHANQTETAAKTSQIVKLFIDEELKIKAGCKIVVKRRNTEFIFGYSGEAGIYDDHQEIVLIPWEGWVV